MFKSFTLISLCFALSISSLLGQQTSSQAAKVYKEAEGFLLQHEYQKALRSFQKALQLQPSLTAAKRGIGACYELLNNFEQALTYYEEVLSADSLFSRMLYYQTAEAHYKVGNYEKALAFFNTFKEYQNKDVMEFGLQGDREKFQELEYIAKVEGSIKACQVSLDSLQFLNVTEVINLGSGINSKNSEYFPFLSNDQSLLFYNKLKTDKNNNEDLYYSSNTNGKWKNGNPVPGFNTDNSEGMCTMIRDGRRMFFTACKRDGVLGTCDIWEALVNGNEVTSVEALKGYANSDKWESQAAISCDGNTLFFASNREGGLGGTDLWFSKRQDDGKWSPPLNLGPKINTPYDEEAPFITNDGKTLYFSSTGHLGMGEQDIFMSWLDFRSDEWSVPINLGPPVNSAYRELGFFLSADGKTGYFASNRPGGYGEMDIYSFELSRQLHSEPVTFVEGFVRDSVIDTPINTAIRVNGLGVIHTDEEGRFFLCVGADEVLDLEVNKDRFKPYHNQFPIPEWDNRAFYNLKLLLQPTISFLTPYEPNEPEEEESEVLTPRSPKVEKEYHHTIFFEFDQHDLNTAEISGLDDFLGPIKDSEIKSIEVFGFSDDIGTDFYNLELSEKRAKQTALYLVNQGLEIDQVYMKGFGEIQDDNPRGLNRRVEVKIVVWE